MDPLDVVVSSPYLLLESLTKINPLTISSNRPKIKAIVATANCLNFHQIRGDIIVSYADHRGLSNGYIEIYLVYPMQ
jgi:hypothetical protein